MRTPTSPMCIPSSTSNRPTVSVCTSVTPLRLIVTCVPDTPSTTIDSAITLSTVPVPSVTAAPLKVTGFSKISTILYRLVAAPVPRHSIPTTEPVNGRLTSKSPAGPWVLREAALLACTPIASSTAPMSLPSPPTAFGMAGSLTGRVEPRWSRRPRAHARPPHRQLGVTLLSDRSCLIGQLL